MSAYAAKDRIARLIGSASLPVPEAKRLVVGKAKWLHDADSPAMLMIDDFTNAYHTDDDSAGYDRRGDWGGGHRRPRSTLSFLEQNLFARFPEVRTTFFLVVGRISQYTFHQPFRFAEPIDYDDASADFFRGIATDPRFEIAYHGFNHGKPGKTTLDFIQEWKCLDSVDAGIAQIGRGMDICRRTLGIVLRGGKYGGWEYNGVSDETVDACGFSWWCRDWTPKDISGRISTDYYEPQFFGGNRVVALPSTVHGRRWTRAQIDRLLEDRQIISIEEHIAALRPDGGIQTPNVHDDISALNSLFGYLRQKNVWFATASEIADYVKAYADVFISDITPNSFRIQSGELRGDSPITLLIQLGTEMAQKYPNVLLACPDGLSIRPESLTPRDLLRFTVSPVPGIYYVRDA